MTARKQPQPEAAARPGAGLRAAISAHRGFLCILVAGIAVRLWNVGWGLPYLYEEAIPLRFGMKLWPSLPPAADYHFFVYPALTYYLQLALQFLHFCAGYATGTYQGLPAFIALFDADPTAFTIIARCTTILFDAGIIVTCYALLDSDRGRTAALIGAAFISLNVLHIRESHLVNVDTPLAFFSVAALWCFSRMMETPSVRRYLLSGAAVGLAAASKYNGGILILALAAAHFMTGSPVRAGFRAGALRRLAAAGAAAAAVFLLFNPLIVPHSAEFLEKFRSTESHMDAGHLGLDPGTSTVSFYLFESLPGGLGIPILTAALLSAVWLAMRKEQKDFLLLLMPALYAAMLAMWSMRADRYIFPAVPFLLMIAAAGTAKFSELLAMKLSPPGGSGAARPRPPAAYVSGALALLLLIQPALAALDYQRIAGLRDTRTAAREWIMANLKQGSAVATGPFGIELPVTRYITVPIPFSAVHSERMTPFYNPGWYQDIDLLVVSDFDYGRYRLEPGRFREILAYLDTLRAGWTVVRAFGPGDSLSGPSITLFRHPGLVEDVPYPAGLLEQMLSYDLETELKVAFLGQLGLIQSLNGRLTRSEQLLRTVLMLEPGNATAEKSLREILSSRSGRGRAAQGGGRDAGAAGPASSPPAGQAFMDALIARGDSLLTAGDADGAERIYRAVLARDDRQVNAYLGLTLVYAARDDRDGVVRTLRDLLEVLPPGSEDYARVALQLKSIEEGGAE